MLPSPRRLLDSLETDGALRVGLLAGGALALEHLGEGDLLLLSRPAARCLAGLLDALPPQGAFALPDGSRLAAEGPDLRLSQGGYALVFLRREARDLAAAIAEMDALADDLEIT